MSTCDDCEVLQLRGPASDALLAEVMRLSREHRDVCVRLVDLKTLADGNAEVTVEACAPTRPSLNRFAAVIRARFPKLGRPARV